ncbi:hypothetical protein L227DRAFT_165078 [Lentinus tigrinus ALCF2SS1-6]|uniref:Secreted protein n=1 Tax=Lentinus tigrinus ALCF2SS1-6 TaxID=1328759 RepID=A0A5C2S637_9APHY|nr:hypothetical protein L227DRAFT_165078 [Lentinus tigrinus ALCF2SS1-6]
MHCRAARCCPAWDVFCLLGCGSVTCGVWGRQEDRPRACHTTAVGGTRCPGAPRRLLLFWLLECCGHRSIVLVDEEICVSGVRATEVCVLGNGNRRRRRGYLARWISDAHLRAA